MPCYRFDLYVLDTERRTLKRDGAPVVTTPKVFETLSVLIKNRGRVMEKDELLRTLWPDTAVEEANLTQSVSTLRKVLGDDAKIHRYIATIPGRGYSFVAPANEIPCDEDKSVAERQLQPDMAARNSRILYAWTGVCLILAGAAFYFAHPHTRHLPEPQISRLTSFPGVETMPAFSPVRGAKAKWMGPRNSMWCCSITAAPNCCRTKASGNRCTASAAARA